MKSLLFAIALITCSLFSVNIQADPPVEQNQPEVAEVLNNHEMAIGAAKKLVVTMKRFNEDMILLATSVDGSRLDTASIQSWDALIELAKSEGSTDPAKDVEDHIRQLIEQALDQKLYIFYLLGKDKRPATNLKNVT